MKRFCLILTAVIMLLTATGTFAQQFAGYHARHFFLAGPAGAYQDGLLGFANPATTVMLQRFNMRYYWSTQEDDNADIQNWGFFTAAPNLGFGMLREKIDGKKVTDYNLSLGFGSRSAAFGIGYTWQGGEKARFARERLWSLGWLFRPGRYISAGIVGNFSAESNAKEGVLDLGIRPLGNPRLTLFGDYALQKDQPWKDGTWSAGAALEVLPGINFSARYFDSERVTAGLAVSLGSGRISGQTHLDEDNEVAYNTYSVGFGEYTPSIFANRFSKRRYFLEMHLKGRVDYRKFRWFDDHTQRFWELLQQVNRARENAAVEVIALNLSAMSILPEHAWELREALQAVRAAGKKVVIFFDNAGMTAYHLASVADVVMMDPQGSLMLPGYTLNRTYLKGTLEKLGLGFDEWRFFKYKSAAEALSRDSMSTADREQRQAYVDDIYDLIRSEVSASRGINEATFDRLIDEGVYFMAQDALAESLVDTLCRWNALGDVIRSLTGGNKMRIRPEQLNEGADAYQNWGTPPQIAIVYGLGECAMDSGINARQLAKIFERLTKDRSVKAVVFRVDSPGGDGMASDVVAEALKKCAAEKPVVVSQGQVAGSGGYWISMYGSAIMAGPGTITGSIGVIGGWLYDKGFSDKLGMTSDHVSRGAHADLFGAGVRLPLFGVQIPARNLTEVERSRMEKFIREYYRDFVEKVAAGRNMSVDAVETLAQGRIYSGTDGKANGLVDEIGGLDAAVEKARQMAGIPAGEEYQVIEIQKYKGLFDPGTFSPLPMAPRLADDPVLRFIRIMSEHPGFPYPMLLPGTYPVLEDVR